jgi:hypothetical protein
MLAAQLLSQPGAWAARSKSKRPVSRIRASGTRPMTIGWISAAGLSRRRIASSSSRSAVEQVDLAEQNDVGESRPARSTDR